MIPVGGRLTTDFCFDRSSKFLFVVREKNICVIV
jgi:hypothetical protein